METEIEKKEEMEMEKEMEIDETIYSNGLGGVGIPAPSSKAPMLQVPPRDPGQTITTEPTTTPLST